MKTRSLGSVEKEADETPRGFAYYHSFVLMVTRLKKRRQLL